MTSFKAHHFLSFPRIEEMNVSWCDFNNLHVQAIANDIPSSITQLNISGYRQNLTMEGKEGKEFKFM